MKRLVLLALLLLAGCCDSTCSCRAEARNLTQRALDAIAAIGTTGSAASQAAVYVLHDPVATQERKAQALQLLFELERGRKLDETAVRLDDTLAKLTVLMERKVEAE